MDVTRNSESFCKPFEPDTFSVYQALETMESGLAWTSSYHRAYISNELLGNTDQKIEWLPSSPIIYPTQLTIAFCAAAAIAPKQERAIQYRAAQGLAHTLSELFNENSVFDSEEACEQILSTDAKRVFSTHSENARHANTDNFDALLC